MERPGDRSVRQLRDEAAGPSRVSLATDAVFTGLLQTEDSAPLGNSTVKVRVDEGEISTVETDTDGAFTFSHTFARLDLTPSRRSSRRRTSPGYLSDLQRRRDHSNAVGGERRGRRNGRTALHDIREVDDVGGYIGAQTARRCADQLFVRLPWTVISTGLIGVAAVSIFLIAWARILARE